MTRWYHAKLYKCCFVPDIFVSKMVLALLKCYGSVESSSEEEFAGLPEKIPLCLPRYRNFLSCHHQKPIPCGGLDGSFSTGPILKKRRLSKKEKLKKAVAKKRRSGHRVISRVEIITMNSKYWSLNCREQSYFIRCFVQRDEISRWTSHSIEGDPKKTSSYVFHVPAPNGTQIRVCR